MRLIDTHCHLDLKQYEQDRDLVIKRAIDTGVVRFIVPGINVESSKKAIQLSIDYDEVFASCGIHPHEADKITDQDTKKIEILARDNSKVVAIGEIGLDYYREFSSKENQIKLFTECVRIAKHLDYPIIVHSRQADEDVLKILKEEHKGVLRGVIHCFSGNKFFLKEVIDLGFYVSFTGGITFEKSVESRELLKYVPMDRLLLETDAPYITPEPFRGKRNEPGYVKYLLPVLEEIYSKGQDEIAEVTTKNADNLFRLGIQKENTISYKIRNSLYLNITYRCTNRCSFCTREISDYVKGYDLKLDKEPSYEEIIDRIKDPKEYDEVVFCGFGEPTLRLEVIKKVSAFVKKNGGKVRITTNGEGNIINGRDITVELKGLIDRVSVSLNASDKEEHDKICNSVYGKDAYPEIINFIKECSENGIKVEITCLDIINEQKQKECKEIAAKYGAEFRLRHMNAVG